MDKIEQIIDGAVTYQDPDPLLSYRNILNRHTSVRPWSEFAVNLVIGADADCPIGYRQESFAPIYLKNLAANAVITDTAGIERPLVLPEKKILEPNHVVDFGNPLFTPFQIMWMAFLLVLLLSLIGWYKNKPYWLIDVILFSLQGLGGIIIALIFFFSEHPTVHSNWLVICFNPLPLLFIPFMVHRIRRGKISYFMFAEFTVCSAFLLFKPVIPQTVEPAVMVLIGTFALRALSTSLFQLLTRIRTAKKKKAGNLRLTLILLALSISANLYSKPETSPKLVVGIVVDQLDEECLEKLMPIMGTDGFKRLWIDGYNRTNASFDYEGMDRASAVASVYTGASPFQHGIVAGRWMNPRTLMPSSPLDDSNYKGINTIEMSSPKQLLATNLADEMKLGSGNRSKICSVAIERDL